MAKAKQDKIILLLGLAIIGLLLLNSLVFYFRADLSENQAYTISQTSREILAALDAPVRVDYYVSGILRNAEPEIAAIVDLLNEYANASGGKVELRVIDTDGQEEALGPDKLGLEAKEYPVQKNNQFINTLVYTGVVVTHLNKTKVLPLVTDPREIEYQLSTGIRSLSQSKKPIAGLLVGTAEGEISGQFSAFPKYLEEMAELRVLKPGEMIPADIDVLFVFGTAELGALDAWGIDQFLMSGKGVLIGVDGLKLDLASNWQVKPVPSGIINELLASYGVEVGSSWVLDDNCRNIPFNQQQGKMTIQRMIPYPAWVAVSGKGLNQDNPLSARTAGLDLLWASRVSLAPGVEGEILFSSSLNARETADFPSGDPSSLLAGQRQSHQSSPGSFGKPIPLGVLRKGAITSYFDAHDPKTVVSGHQLPQAVKSQAAAHLVVIGDAEFGSDLYQSLYQNRLLGGENIVFLRNAFQYLARDTAMMNIRTRQIRDTRLSAISDQDTKSLIGNLALLLNAGLIPAGVVAFGVVRAIKRRKAAKEA